MKTYKFIISFIVLAIGMLQGLSAQPYFEFRFSPAPFVGTWEAKQGNNSYELVIRTGKWYVEQFQRDADILTGELIYRTNGEMVRHFKEDGIRSVFTGNPLSISEMSFTFNDRERDAEGMGVFSLFPNDPSKAKWELRRNGRSRVLLEGEKPPKRAELDIPLNLQWRKVE